MTLLNVGLAEEPLDVDSFNYLSDSNYPFTMLGFQLKNSYDQQRLVINENFNPTDIIHFVPNEPILPKFFRGISIKIREKYLPLIRQLDAAGLRPGASLSRDSYKALLKEYNLKCDNCYAYLDKGIYPIDSEFLNIISATNIKYESLYDKVLFHENKFQSFAYFTIYVLSNKNYLKTTTKNFLKAAIEKYNF